MRRTWVTWGIAQMLSGDSFGLQLLRLVVSDERVDEWIEVAFHHEVELMNRQPDAVIADAVLFEIVSANLLRTIAGANHRAAFTRLRFVLLLLFKLLQTRAQDTHRLLAVFNLRL